VTILSVFAEMQNRKDPWLRIDTWKRFPAKLDFETVKRMMVMGIPGAGKSSLLETLGVIGEHKIIDIFSSRDDENLSICYNRKYKDSVLFIIGDNAKVSTEYDTKPVSELTLKDISEYKAVLSSPSFYQTTNDGWKAVNRISEVVWKRSGYKKGDIWNVIVREGNSLLYSRIGLGGDQGSAKNQLIYAIREFRHSGCSMIIDALDFMGLDVSFRRITDYFFVKAVGIEGLPDKLSWMYRYYDLFVDLMQMPKWCFAFFSNKGAVGDGVNTVPYWHKQEDWNMLEMLDIQVEFEGEPGEQNRHITDFKHVEIMKMRTTLNKRGKPTSEGDIALALPCSSKTIHDQLNHHNLMIASKGECDRCARAKSDLTKINVL
jgi:energy-coupling factor transporter ATP-binding protein EcfA2